MTCPAGVDVDVFFDDFGMAVVRVLCPGSEAGVAYLREKSFYTLHALYHAHLLNRVVESCSIQGIDVTDELVRGSQYKIENLLLRINNSSEFNFICLNATEKQVSVGVRCE